MEPTIAQKIADPRYPYHTEGVVAENEQHAIRLYPPKTIKLDVPDPIVGAKGWAVDTFGIVIAEDGPGVLRAIACPHAGSANMHFYDCDPIKWPSGRRMMFPMSPVVIGQYMLDMGFIYGLVVEIGGRMLPMMTFTWMKAGRNGRNSK